jgi:hypothetical protein
LQANYIILSLIKFKFCSKNEHDDQGNSQVPSGSMMKLGY